MRHLTAAFAPLALFLVVGCANPAANAPDAEVSEPAPSTQAPEPAPREVPAFETLVFKEPSKISFVGSKVTGSHDGGFQGFEGTVTLMASGIEDSSVSVVIDTASVWTDSPRLTEHLRSSDFFDVGDYPTSTFDATTIEAQEDGSYKVTGNFTLHGVTKSISFPATIEKAAGGVHVAAEFAIDRFDFNIRYKGAADDLIRNEVLIKLDLYAKPPV